MKKVSKLLSLLSFVHLLLTGCDLSNGSQEHEHTFSNEWTYNETHHWHAATCNHTNQKSDLKAHQFDEWIIDEEATQDKEGKRHRICEVCGYRIDTSYDPSNSLEKLEYVLSSDGTSYSVKALSKKIEGDVRIYAFHDGLPVTGVVEHGFEECSRLTSITMANSVTSIGEHAFFWCQSLKSVTLSNNITVIKDHTFDLCESLTSIDIPEGVTSIGEYGFANCHALETVHLPSSLAVMGNYVFASCESLKAINIPNKVKVINTGSFAGCFALKDVTIGSGVTTIKEEAFNMCSSIETLIIPDSVITIENNAFSYCTSLRFLSLGKGLTNLAYGAFYNCYHLVEIVNKSKVDISSNYYDESNVANWALAIYKKDTESKTVTDEDGFVTFTDNKDTYLVDYVGEEMDVVIPSSVNKIHSRAFYNSLIKTVNIPEGVTSIGERAFCSCENLTSISVPNSVVNIEQEAFDGCPKLQYHQYDNAKYLGNDHSPYVVLIKAKSQSITACQIHEDCKIIYDWAFRFCQALTSVVIPDGVTSIGEYAFYGCISLSSVKLSEELIIIKKGAFNSCISLFIITIPKNVTTIEEYAFSGCICLFEIVNKSSLKIKPNDISYGDIGRYARRVIDDEKDSRLTIDENGFVIYPDTDFTWLVAYQGNKQGEITIPSNITRINDRVFENCTKITAINIQDSVTTIGAQAFKDCTSLTSIDIPDSVISFSLNVFDGCTSLKTVSWSKSTSIIPLCAFANCRSLTAITSLDDVRSIGDHAFANCTALKEISFGQYLEEIQTFAFSDCTSLASISYNGTKEEWATVRKDNGWHDGVPAKVVHCLDGDAAI